MTQDLTTCDTWPVRSPDAIQPFGHLLALSADGRTVTHWSRNLSELVPWAADEASVFPLSRLLTRQAAGALEGIAATQRHDAVMPPLRLELVNGGNPQAWVHRQAGRVIVELERFNEEASELLFARQEAVSSFVARMDALDDPIAVCEAASIEIKALTGYDRVMIYRFHEDLHGEVIAEERNPDLESWLGLHYPATDIPAPARAVFAANKLRMIPEVEYVPVPIVARSDDRASLDLTRSLLRSVAPIHIEYLRNMRVTASLTLSLKQGDKLWGLIACHHYSGPKYASSSLRSACSILADYLGAAITLKSDKQAFAFRASKAGTEARLREQLAAASCPVDSLTKGGVSLLELMSEECGGAAVVRGANVALVGRTPSEEHVREIASWLRQESRGPVFWTNGLSKHLPSAADIASSAAGLLAVVPADAAASTLLWFKPEMVQTVTWAGDPEKSADVSGMRLHPRKSFDAWVQTVRNFSQPWRPGELDVAGSLLMTITSDELRRRVEDEKRARAEAERANQTKQEFVAVISHDLRDPLSSLSLNVLLLKKLLPAQSSTTLPTVVASMDRAIVQMTGLVKALLDLSAMESGQLKLERSELNAVEVVHDCINVLTPLATEKNIELGVELPRAPVKINADRAHLLQVCSNLIGNAIKFTPAGGEIRLALSESPSSATFQVTDTGPGVAEKDLPHIFDRFYRAGSTKTGGVGLGLAIAKGVVEAHGGRIGARSEPGAGATFWFSIPKR
jgi:two-component system, chemotaxis family, sensor kinase Cph1